MSFVRKYHDERNSAKNDSDYIRDLKNMFHDMMGLTKGKSTLYSECLMCYNLLNSYFNQNEKVISRWVEIRDLYLDVLEAFRDAYDNRYEYNEEIRGCIEKIDKVFQNWNSIANFDSHRKTKKNRAQHWETRDTDMQDWETGDTDMRNLLARLKNT
jgi:hypothetical protein